MNVPHLDPEFKFIELPKNEIAQNKLFPTFDRFSGEQEVARHAMLHVYIFRILRSLEF